LNGALAAGWVGVAGFEAIGGGVKDSESTEGLSLVRSGNRSFNGPVDPSKLELLGRISPPLDVPLGARVGKGRGLTASRPKLVLLPVESLRSPIGFEPIGGGPPVRFVPSPS
jgi:hypothetical protein